MPSTVAQLLSNTPQAFLSSPILTGLCVLFLNLLMTETVSVFSEEEVAPRPAGNSNPDKKVLK